MWMRLRTKNAEPRVPKPGQGFGLGAAVFFFLPILVLAQANSSFHKPDPDPVVLDVPSLSEWSKTAGFPPFATATDGSLEALIGLRLALVVKVIPVTPPCIFHQ